MPAIRPSVPATMTDEAADGPPALLGPADVGAAPPPGAGSLAPSRLPALTAGAGNRPAPLVIDSSRHAPDPLGAFPSGAKPARGDSASSARGLVRRPEPMPEPPGPPQRRKLFGFIPFGRPVPAPATPSARDLATEDSGPEPDEPGPEKKDDAIADRALERRLEAQIRTAAGNHIRSLEVRASGRQVFVKAQPARFWQKRGLKRTLEGLPALAGYRSRIEVVD
jgi:hypothetical protein